MNSNQFIENFEVDEMLENNGSCLYRTDAMMKRWNRVSRDEMDLTAQESKRWEPRRKQIWCDDINVEEPHADYFAECDKDSIRQYIKELEQEVEDDTENV